MPIKFILVINSMFSMSRFICNMWICT